MSNRPSDGSSDASSDGATNNDPSDHEPRVRDRDRAASGVPHTGWALGDRFAWEEVHQRLVASADEEMGSNLSELTFSGFTAGFAIVLTFMGHAVGSATFPENPFLAAILYPIGFLFIILGRYQLYTENTLPPVKLVLTRLASVPLLLRLWAVVLAANLVGAAAGALILANTEVLSPEAMEAGAALVREGVDHRWSDLFFKAMFAGWLVAGLVWLVIAARDTISRLVITYLVFYSIPVLGLYHVVSTAAEAFFFAFGDLSGPGAWALFTQFWLPVLLGNTFGGVVLIALAGYAQSEQRTFPEFRVLSTREVLFTMKGGRPFRTPRPGVQSDGSTEADETHE